MNARIGFVMAVSVFLAQPAFAQAVADQPLSLPALEQMALERSPTLAQAASGVEAARGRATQAGLLPNPVMGYTGEEVSTSPTIRGGEHGFFIEQTIPLGGKLRLGREVFLREAAQADVIVTLQRQRVLNAVRIAYYEVLAAARRIEIRERLAETADEAVAVSGQLYNVGAADQPDVLEAEIEAGEARLGVEEARDMRQAAWKRLAAVVGDPSMPLRPLQGSIDEPTPRLDLDETLRGLLTGSPELASARAGAERAEAALARARRDPAPDLVLRGGPRYNRELLDPGPRPVGWEAAVDVGITVPLFNRNQGGVAAAAAAARSAGTEARRLELSLQERFAEVFQEYTTAARAADSYRTAIVPRAEQAFELHQARFRQMAAAYPQVLVARRSLLQVSERYVNAAARAWRAVITLQGFLLTDGLTAPWQPMLNPKP